ncbi:MAG: T9SS type A sorting domain-containing protein [Bacteroidales bacterium]|jgi:hypothetical protein|nr:T9SS type A sorting domain-containing protein [Mariniphaga sp.]NLB92612.1 T9SS type A sorting domain-containing protein [Bacteroidales bacterium]
MKRYILLIIFSLIFIRGFSFEPSYSSFYQNPTIDKTSVQELKIYPNPAENGRITLEMNTGEITEIRLVNIMGKEVVVRILDFSVPKYQLTLENIPNGIYFVRVKTSKNKVVVKKLIVSSR